MNPQERRLLEVARRAREATERSISADDAATAANRAEYAMLYAAQAALVGEEMEVRSHGAVHAAFGIRFAETARLDPRVHRWLLDAFDLRPWRTTTRCGPWRPSRFARPSSKRVG